MEQPKKLKSIISDELKKQGLNVGEDMVATVRLNSSLSAEDKSIRSVKQTAKHEALHLLLFRLEHRAYSRYVLEEEIYETVEGLVFRLEGLIPDIK